jgi:hypothetical protein
MMKYINRFATDDEVNYVLMFDAEPKASVKTTKANEARDLAAFIYDCIIAGLLPDGPLVN